MWIEIIGIVATLFILLSMCINTQSWKGDVWMRIINTIGSIIFTVYGFLLPAYSTGILNTLLVFVNGYHLIKLIKNKEKLQAMEQNQSPSQQQTDKTVKDKNAK